MHICVAP